DVTGSPTPDDLDGVSMLPLLKGDESKARDWAFVDYSKGGTPPYRHFVRTKRYKLYSTGELYDVPNDWMEQNALTSPETDGVRKRLQTVLDDILKDHPSDEEIKKRQSEKGLKDAGEKKNKGAGKKKKGTGKKKKKTADA
ncbi:MAG: DUF4976 domain-containing protein, partial [Kiritimatiellales bacterium]|nr:DUF4976 domain-containing protein [Kiritimatiellales bacterium]